MSVTLPYISEKYDQNAFVTALNAIVDELDALKTSVDAVPTDVVSTDSFATMDEVLKYSGELSTKISELTDMLLVEARNRGADIVSLQNKLQSDSESIARTIEMLTASIGNNAAGILTTKTTLVNLHKSMSEQVSVMVAEFNGNIATVSESVTAVADEVSALATTVTNLTATYNANKTDTDNIIAANTASISTEQSARASADSALASSITTLSSSVSALSTTVGTLSTSVTSQASSINGLQGKYGVKIDSNGYVSGFSMNNDSTTSDFIINADKFQITKPGATAATFTVEDGKVKINGGLIVNGSTNTAQIAANAVTIPLSAYGGSSAATASYFFDGQTPVIVLGYGFWNQNSGWLDSGYIQVMRNGSVLFGTSVRYIGYGFITPIFVDIPPYGLSSYSTVLSSYGAACSIVILGTKR